MFRSLYRGGFERQAVIRRRRHPLQVERVLPEAVDVLGQIWTQARHRLGLDLVAFRRQLVQHPRQGIDVVKDQAVGDQVIFGGVNLPVLEDKLFFDRAIKYLIHLCQADRLDE